MIETRVEPEVGIVINTVVGSVSLAELADASARTHELAKDDFAVLWDFRLCKLVVPVEIAKLPVTEWFKSKRTELSTSKRAFVVATSEQEAVVEALVKPSTAPWPWGVFHELEAALDWLHVDRRLVLSSQDSKDFV